MKILLIVILSIFLCATVLADCVSCHTKGRISTQVPDKLILQDLVLVNAEKYLYVRELTNNNDHPMIDKWLHDIGLPKGLSWCAAFIVGVYKEASDSLKIKNPLPKLGKVSTLWEFTQENELRYKTFEAEEVLSGEEKLNKADLAIWAHGIIKNNDFSGHVEINRYQETNNRFASIGGNTTPGDNGNQREGGGVYERERKLAIGSSFQVLGFIRIR